MANEVKTDLAERAFNAVKAKGIELLDTLCYDEDGETTFGVEVYKKDAEKAVLAFQSCGLDDCDWTETIDGEEYAYVYGHKRMK